MSPGQNPSSKSPSVAHILSLPASASNESETSGGQTTADTAPANTQREIYSPTAPGDLPLPAPAYSEEDPNAGLYSLGCLLPQTPESLAAATEQSEAHVRLLTGLAAPPPNYDESETQQDKDTHRSQSQLDWAAHDQLMGIVQDTRDRMTAKVGSLPRRFSHVWNTGRQLLMPSQGTSQEHADVTNDTRNTVSPRPARYTLWPQVNPADLSADLRSRADTYQTMMDTLPRLSAERSKAGHQLLDGISSSFDTREDFGGISEDVVRQTLAPLADGLDLAECLHLAEHAKTQGSTSEAMLRVFSHYPGQLLNLRLAAGPTRGAFDDDTQLQQQWLATQRTTGQTEQERPRQWSALSDTLREIRNHVEPCLKVLPEEYDAYLKALGKERKMLAWLAEKLPSVEEDISAFAKADESARRFHAMLLSSQSDGCSAG